MLTNQQFTKPMKHPLHLDQPMERAEIIEFWHVNGRNIGLVLEFGDEHRTSLKYGEIAELQKVEEVATI